MAANATAERPNKVKVTDIGPCLKKLHIEIPAETVTEQLGTSIDTLLVEAELPGFRKGRAPKRLVEKKFGSTIRREAKNQLVASAYQKAIEDNKLRVVGDPSSDTLDKVEITDGKALSFEIELEVSPEFELPNLEGIEVKKPKIEITDDMIKGDMDRLALNEGSLKSKEKIDAGDYLTGHAIMKGEDNKEILNINDAVIQVPTEDKNGKGMILGVNVDDFSKQIGKPKIGDTVTIKTTGPEQHENEAVRGKKLSISFQIKRADEIVPASLEEVARRYGLENDSQVKDAVKSRIEQRVQVDQASAMRNQIAKYLLDNTEMELPERITAAQAGRNLERARMELMYRGMDAAKIEEQLAELRSGSADQAANELKLYFAIDKAAEKMDVKVTEGEMNARIAQMAYSRGDRPERLRQEIIARNQVGTVYQQIREHKTMDAILSKAKIEDIALDEYNKSVTESKGKKSGSSAKKSEHKAEKAEKHDEGDDKPKSKGKKKGE
jgi:trigger factor